MKNEKLIAFCNVIFFAIMSMVSHSASAEIIDFSDVFSGQDFSPVEHVHGNYYIDAYKDISDKESEGNEWFLRLISWGWQEESRTLSMDKYGRAVVPDFPTIVSITHQNNEAFNFHSIALADGANRGGIPYEMEFRFYAFGSDDFTTTKFSMTSVPYGETFVFDQQNLGRVEMLAYWNGQLSDVQFDNIMVSSVPEPSSYSMLLAGVCIVGAIGRRRFRRAGASASPIF